MENRKAAGLRRSAIAERLRLREEWTALKGINEDPTQKNVLKKRQANNINNKRTFKETPGIKFRNGADKENSQFLAATSEVLRGMVVLVDVGSETRALALRAALSALGATVVSAWSPLVTHLVWSQGGCRDTRARARALACRVVSPLWVEACAGAGRALPEGVFPAPPRPSDLPSPRALRLLLKKAERENLSFLLADSQRDQPKRLRISSETDSSANTSHDTSKDKSTDKSHDKSTDKSHDKSTDKSCESPDEEVRVNTAPRRALPVSTSPERSRKSRRKLFTQQEPDGTKDAESEQDVTPAPKKMTLRERRDLAKAERMARRLVTPQDKRDRQNRQNRLDKLRIVLTGMSRTERRIITKAIKHLKGHIQSKVDKWTDYVLLGSCSDHCPDSLSDMLADKLNINKNKENVNNRQENANVTGIYELSETHTGPVSTRVSRIPGSTPNDPGKSKDNGNDKDKRNLTSIEEANESDIPTMQDIQNCLRIGSGLTRANEKPLSNVETLCNINEMVSTQLRNEENILCTSSPGSNVNTHLGPDSTQASNVITHLGPDSTQASNIITHLGPDSTQANNVDTHLGPVSTRVRKDFSQLSNYSGVSPEKPRTVNTLLGAVRGCRVLYANWAVDSVRQDRWMHHIGYEVKYLMKISQKARVERSALGLMKREYAYNVFRGMRVRLTADADQRDAVSQLLSMCGAVVIDAQDGGLTQNGGNKDVTTRTQNGGLPQNGGNQDDTRAQHGGLTQNGGNKDVTTRTQNGGLPQNGGNQDDTRAQHGGLTQNGGKQDGSDITIGIGPGEICSKWVFDSITAARMRTTRRYVN